jgi:hypothetical protein
MKRGDMNRNRRKTLAAAIAVFGCGLTLGAASAESAIAVKVSESTSGGATTYHYRVVNDSAQPVVGLRIGFDYAHGVPQLSTEPAGWTLAAGLAPGSAASPQGWTARLVTTEESDFVDMEWSNDGEPYFDIAPGASKGGFSVTLAAPSPEYRNSMFDVILGDSTHEFGALQYDTDPPPPSDVQPPVLTVTLSPATIWPPNHQMVTVTADVVVTDETDPQPAVRLISVTANEAIDPGADILDAATGTDDRSFRVRAERTGRRKEGRVYTVTYQATDAAGNVTTTAAAVTVPHDQRP